MTFNSRSATIGGAVLLAAAAATVNGGMLLALEGVKPILHTVLGTASLVTGALFYLRLRTSQQAADMAFAYGFILIGAGTVTLALARSMNPADAADGFAVAFAIRAVGLIVVALAALDFPRGVVAVRHVPLWFGGGIVVTALLVGTLAELAGAEFQQLLWNGNSTTSIMRSTDVPLMLSGVHFIVIVALATAAYACRLRAVVDGDDLFNALAAGFILFAVARLCQLLFPGITPPGIHAVDVFRLSGHGVILAAGFSSLLTGWRAALVSHAEEERQQVARDLHDGIAQELALLSAHSRWLAARSDDSDDLAFVAVVAQSALEESRRTISQLRRSSRNPGPASGRS